MDYINLGSSNMQVSRVCLGSMTWGTQNSQQDANEQIEFALAHGVNFIDTAEMYAVPPSSETYGSTETIIGNWLADNPVLRKDIVLATKISGNGLPWVRDGGDITGKAIMEAVDNSLQRLQTDYIDLYQLHWPNRTSPHFAKHWPGMVKFSEVDRRKESKQMVEILEALDACMQAGKIKHFGLSDDTPWGISEYLRLSETYGLPKPVSIQNEFSLIHHKDWPYLLETCYHEGIAYLPWSPLGGGVLSGKYLNGAMPDGARWTQSQRNGIFRDTPEVNRLVGELLQIANEYEMNPSQLALAWINQVEGVSSTIIGATSIAQLEDNIKAFDMQLNDEVLAAINELIRSYPSPF